MDPEVLDVGYVLDSNYVEATSVSCLSVMLRARRKVRFHVASLSGALRLLPAVQRHAAKEGHQICYLSLRPPLDGHELPALAFHQHVTGASWLIFRLFDEAETESGHLLYLDGDTLVLGSLDPAPLTPVSPSAVAARIDPWNPTIDSPKGVQAWAELGLPPGASNVNSGVVCVDVERWRDDSLTAAVVQGIAFSGPRMLLGDQEALNAALAGRVTPLPPEYNAMVMWDIDPYNPGLRRARQSPSEGQVIRHFAGWRKPWLPEWQSQPHGEEWHRLRRMLLESGAG
ncbi:glycosyltransferase family 8 protein [Microbacterium natoriense]|uniref:glycosyltransferase family 8 protein n=1 Tax=Microbacterium natoriense TaxID=284570 RepID=UPI0027D8D3A0|nr:glycosyltransferase [Microbacterium natoriense]